MNSEKELVRGIRTGDARAFETLVETYEHKIYALALRFTGNPQDALDAAQEVFLRVFRFIGSFNEESRLSTWLYRIATNVCKDMLAKRSRSRELSLEQELDGEGYVLDMPDTRYSPEETLAGKELQSAIVTAIEALPQKYREVVVLRDISGLSYDEIAATLGLEVGTVKSRLARGRERLRSALLHDGNLSPTVQSKKVKGGDNP